MLSTALQTYFLKKTITFFEIKFNLHIKEYTEKKTSRF